MHFCPNAGVVMVATCLLVAAPGPAVAGPPEKTAPEKTAGEKTAQEKTAGDSSASPSASAIPAARQAVERGLKFLIDDTARWREKHNCATCHHGALTSWALSAARKQGYPVAAETLADMLHWTRGQFIPRFNKPRDPRPGWNMVQISAIYLGAMSQDLPVLSREEVHQVAVHLARHQDEDGAWTLQEDIANQWPPTWESHETVALWGLLAWEPYVPADSQAAAAATSRREKALQWVTSTQSTGTTQAVTLRLLLDARTGKPAAGLQPGIERLLQKQNADGGWSPTPDLPSDAYATGEALYALGSSGVTVDRPEVQKAVSFLVESQRADGSWPMTPRTQPGVEKKRSGNAIPITCFGSAWGVLGLVRMVPAHDPPTKVAK